MKVRFYSSLSPAGPLQSVAARQLMLLLINIAYIVFWKHFVYTMYNHIFPQSQYCNLQELTLRNKLNLKFIPIYNKILAKKNTFFLLQKVLLVMFFKCTTQNNPHSPHTVFYSCALTSPRLKEQTYSMLVQSCDNYILTANKDWNIHDRSMYHRSDAKLPNKQSISGCILGLDICIILIFHHTSVIFVFQGFVLNF